MLGREPVYCADHKLVITSETKEGGAMYCIYLRGTRKVVSWFNSYDAAFDALSAMRKHQRYGLSYMHNALQL